MNITEAPGRVLVSDDVLLDSRLALYHRRERWLAVADLHFGYELSQRAAGALFPMWGMDTIETRLRALLADYRPERLVIVGDFVHDRTARQPAVALLGRLREETEVVLLAGNHDRRAFGPARCGRCSSRRDFVSIMAMDRRRRKRRDGGK